MSKIKNKQDHNTQDKLENSVRFSSEEPKTHPHNAKKEGLGPNTKR